MTDPTPVDVSPPAYVIPPPPNAGAKHGRGFMSGKALLARSIVGFEHTAQALADFRAATAQMKITEDIAAAAATLTNRLAFYLRQMRKAIPRRDAEEAAAAEASVNPPDTTHTKTRNRTGGPNERRERR
jgi:hypothetical protein